MKKTRVEKPGAAVSDGSGVGRCVRGTERGDGLCWPVYV